MIVNADLHVHSKFSAGVSKNMSIENLSKEAKKKGIDLLATGDCLHPIWMKEIEEMEKVNDGTLELNNTRFVLTTEVEDMKRVHHLLIFPSFSSVLDFKEAVKGKSVNIDTDGRPSIHLNGEEIAQIAKDVDALFGPCHGFTPWTAIYAYHNTLKSCYGDLADYISLIELGLSADTDYADRVGELQRLTFLTNSDAHSPYPVRLAREFNRFELQDATFEELKKAILRTGGRKIILNVGLPPQEGKYNESACIKCYKHYTLKEAISRGWRCSCGKRIKKGVKDRIEELATYKEPQHPEYRPKYLHLIPLAEIIMKALGQSSPFTRAVFVKWNELIKEFGNEVAVLVDADIEDIGKITEDRIKQAIQYFRENKIIIHPGGGGQYGQIKLPFEAEKVEEVKEEIKIGQRSLFDF